LSNSNKKIKEIVYGLGGFDESKPNNNVIETIYYSEEELVNLEAEAAKAQARQALLDKLGITEDEAKLLLGGN
jgi:hypothetical protein